MADPRNSAIGGLLQDALSLSLATIRAIDAMDSFGHLPADPRLHDAHNDGATLLHQLHLRLHAIEAEVSSISQEQSV